MNNTTPKLKTDISQFPTEFRGCTWEAGWEFDCPAVVYYPKHLMAFEAVGSHGNIDSLVESICSDLSIDFKHNDGGLADEAKWRGWSMKGFARRKNATHVVIRIRWYLDDEGEPAWTEVSRKQTRGLPK